MPYPVYVGVEPVYANRNRLTTFFRLFLAIPHLILVGGAGFAFGSRTDNRSASGEGGLLGAVAAFMAIVSWFTLVLAGTHIAGIRQFTVFYLRWRVRAVSYLMLFEDPYPPFGDGPYPASLEILEPTAPRDRLSIALRLIFVIPHAIVLLFVMIAWCLTTIAAWFVILFTGEYPKPLYDVGVGAMRWRLRVEAYMLLMIDDYPPFSLD
jgi:Domain of unknown function (DUF4389)